MRQMALAAIAYARINGGNFPDSLDQFVGTPEFGARRLVCPMSDLEPPPDGSPKQIIDAAVQEGKISYMYLGRGLTTAHSSDYLVGIELPGNHSRGAMAVYADAHAELLQDQKLIDRIFNQIATGRLPVIPWELRDRSVDQQEQD